MNKPTKNQHYVWRSYLAAWTKTNSTNGQIMCLRNKKLFSVSLMKIAQENCFYGVEKMSEQERRIIYEMTIRNTHGMQRKTNESWLNLYCAPFDFAKTLTANGCSVLGHDNLADVESDQAFRNWNIEHVEKIHFHIEEMGKPYISLLRDNRLDFWKNEVDRDKFSFFLCNQYFRTKKTRDGIITAFLKMNSAHDLLEGVHPQNLWIPLSLIYASNVGIHIAQTYSAVLLQADHACFIVGDQPVINTYATFDMMVAPDNLELFYPITPYSALLLTTDPKYESGQILNISTKQIEQYNALEQRTAKEMVFAIERAHLEPFIS